MDRNERDEIPRIDGTVTPSTLHERVEAVAVPVFDWLNKPVEAIVEGLLERRHGKPTQPGPRG